VNVDEEWQRQEETNRVLSWIRVFGLRKVTQGWDICWFVSGILHNAVSTVLFIQCSVDIVFFSVTLFCFVLRCKA
jgi:hypothetical protein